MNQQFNAAAVACTRRPLSAIHHLQCVSPAAKYASRRPSSVMWLEEEGEFYVPDFLSDGEHKIDPALFAAAEEHARFLREAEGYIDEAMHLADVLRAAMGDAGDGRAMQVDTVLAIVREKLTEAHARLDDYDSKHLNLFIACASQKKK